MTMMKEAKRLIEPPRVSEVLRRHFFTYKGVTQEKLAEAMQVSRHSVSELMNDRRTVTASMALRLAHVLGTDPEFWLNLQQAHDLYQARVELGHELEKLVPLRQPMAESDVVR